METLVALLVVAVAYAGISQAITGFLEQRARLLQQGVAHRVAWNELVEDFYTSRAGVSLRNESEKPEGDIEQHGRCWQWHSQSERVKGEGIIRTEVSVYPGCQANHAGLRPTAMLSLFLLP